MQNQANSNKKSQTATDIIEKALTDSTVSSRYDVTTYEHNGEFLARTCNAGFECADSIYHNGDDLELTEEDKEWLMSRITEPYDFPDDREQGLYSYGY